jgi:pyruvate,water dikinase
MAIAGLPVPAGFHLITSAYKRFVEDNNLQNTIISLVKPEITGKTVSFETASQRIQELIRKPELSDEMKEEILQAYKALGGKDTAVAVRSSANAEDLPELSFAGQQDTYLNVRGGDALIAAVRNCWASLWTPRAISYRHQMGIPQDTVAMAVVVQVMIPSDVSGILFTANPTTGERSELVINASFGLGEAVVGSQVTPDTYIVDRDSLDVKETIIGTKEQMLVSSGKQGTTTKVVAKSRRNESSLPAPLISDLASLAIKVEQLFEGLPQDVEWVVSDEKLWLLQARPITSLPPQPLKNVRWDQPEPGAVLGRSQLVEHIPDPVSTLFEDTYMKKYLQEAWGRNLVKYQNRHYRFEDTHPPSSFIVSTTVNGFAYRHLGVPPKSYGLSKRKPRRPNFLTRRILQLQTYFIWVGQWRYRTLPAYLRLIDRWRQVQPATASIEQLWAGIRELAQADANYWYRGTYWPFAMTRGTEFLLLQFLEKHAPGHFTSGQFLSGLKSRAMQSQLDLYTITELIRSKEPLWELVIATPAVRLLDELQHHDDGRPVMEAIERYFDRYGHQVYTLDFVEPTMAEDPQQVLRNLKMLVLDTDYSPVVRQQELTRKREAALKEAKQAFRGILWWKFQWRLWVARRYYPYREEAMFYFGAAWSVLRLVHWRYLMMYSS